MMNQDDRYIDMDERIDSFLKGLMSVDEEAAFKEEIAVNEELRRRTKERLLLLRGVRQFGQEQDRHIIDSTRKIKQRPRLFSLRRAITAVSVAACLVVAVLVCQRYFYADSEAITYAMAQSDGLMKDMGGTLRGGGTEDTMEKLTPIFNAVKAGDDIEGNKARLRELFILVNDDYVDSEDDFGKEIGWFYAVACLKDRDYAKATEVLKKTLEEYPDFQEASTLLEKLK